MLNKKKLENKFPIHFKIATNQTKNKNMKESSIKKKILYFKKKNVNAETKALLSWEFF